MISRLTCGVYWSKVQGKNVNKQLLWVAGIVTSIFLGAVIAWTGSTNSLTVGGVPAFFAACMVAFLIQWVMFVPAFAYQTEKYYDLTGSLTYISLALFAVLVSGFDVRALLLATLIVIWAARLGSFLFIRISKDGEDKRFRSIKPDFLQFLMTWTIQALWVSITMAAALAAMTSRDPVPLSVFAGLGVLLWIAGFAIEVTADLQKSRFKARPGNQDEFINEGLWRWSRHPNYFGEIVLWLGIALIALPVLQGWQYATLISPLFVVVLLIYISGVRMLEHRANKRWGGDPEYEAYKASTPVLVPRPPAT